VVTRKFGFEGLSCGVVVVVMFSSSYKDSVLRKGTGRQNYVVELWRSQTKDDEPARTSCTIMKEHKVDW